MYICVMEVIVAMILICGGLWLYNVVLPGYYRKDISSHTPVQEKVLIEPPVYTVEKSEPELRYLSGVRMSEYGTALWVHMYPGLKLMEKPEIRWFTGSWGHELAISPAEQLIINELNRYYIHWEREVSFVGMPLSEKGGHYRFDFYLPEHQYVLEYHGKNWHQSPEKLRGDKLKEQFCKDNCIHYITYSGQDYYRMDHEIEQLMSKLGIQSR